MKDNNSRKKIKFILAWYSEQKHRSTTQKLILLNRWIKSCSQFEEYEMAKALLNEKRILIRQIRLSKIGERSFLQKLKLYFKILVRKIKSKNI